MPRFEPFRSLRYGPERLPLVSSPPYDVISASERLSLAEKDAQNIVHVDMPLETAGADRYEAAASLLSSWRRNGVLTLDPMPSLTVYRMVFRDETGRERTTCGVIGALEVVDEGAGGVLPHERTTPKAKTDRLDLTRATECNLSPVWGLSLGSGLATELSEPGESVGSVDAHGVRHIFERITDPERINAICSLVSRDDVVIADGHHRYAVSRTYRDELRSSGSPLASAAETTMTYVAELIEEQLSVAAIHRLYQVPETNEFLSALEEHFEFLACPRVDTRISAWMEATDCLVLLRRDADPVALRPRPSAFEGIRNLDGSRLEHALRACDHDVTYQHGIEQVQALVASGSSDAAILIRPVTVEDIRRTAAERLLMPPKSTFFTPKILTGVTIRPLDVVQP